MRWAWRFGQISREDLERAMDLNPITGSREPPGRALMVDEIEKLYDTAKRDVRRRRGARDAAIFTLLYAGGLRRFEVSGADVTAYTGRSIRVIGKGNKEREIPLNDAAQRAMDRWLEVRGCGPGPLIVSLENPLAPVSPDAIGDAMHRFAKRAGVKDFTTHDGRRTKATNLDEAGADLEDIQHALGHARLATTQAYRRRRQQAQRRERTARLLPVPYS
jgi:site-specific recombinase XerD